jgi:transposase
MTVFVGDDWAEAHHDVHLMNEAGDKLAARRLPEGLEGIAQLHTLIAEHATDPSEVIIGIETERGLWVQALIAAGYQVYAINPLSVSRYRDRHNVAGAKSDPGDAKVLADLVRTDRHNHRPVAGDSGASDGIKVLARAHQNLIWDRTRHTNRLRNDLREYFPAALVAFDDLSHGDAVAVLAKASNPPDAARLSIAQIRSALKRGGRQRNLDSRATEIQQGLRTPQLAAPAAVTAAFAATTKALAEVIAGLNNAITELEAELANHFKQHPDADIYLSLPGLGDVLGARVLAEFGDDPERYDTAKSRRNYAGTSPLPKASGKKRAVLARHIRNRRLYDAIDQWAFCSLQASPGCRQFYHQRRTAGHPLEVWRHPL